MTHRFDRFAEESSEFVSRGAFFVACALLVVVWVLSYFLIRDFDVWQ